MNHRDLVAQATEELRLKTAAHDRLWHLGDADWSVDQDTGEITFSGPDGMVAICPVQIIGTFDTNDSTWLWAWDHPSVQASLRNHAAKLRAYGETNGISELTTRKLFANEEQCWEFTALACKLNDAQGGYRGPSGSALVFMTFGQPRLSAAREQVAGSDTAVANVAADEFTPEIPAPVQLVLTGFIEALHAWEVAAYHARISSKSQDAMETAKENYDVLIREWCVADLTPQPISYGSDPKHDPNTERLVTAATMENRCKVRTQHANSTGFVTDYEYHLRFENGKWLVENLFYVCDDGMYEML